MFTRQKKNFRTFIYCALIVTICLLIGALLWPKDVSPQVEKVDSQQSAETAGKNNEEPEKNTEKENIMSEESSYYLVRKDGTEISLFFVNNNGKEIKLEDTEIEYEFLMPEDQAAFEKGVKVESQEELAALLQDFES